VLPLLVLRPQPDVIDPRYLAWFINQPATQCYFDKCARGTHLRMIPKNCLDDLEVLVPDLATQRLIVEIDSLAQRERALTLQLAEKKLELTEFALLRQVRNTQLHGNGAGRSVARRREAPSGKSERTNS
jgi:restriction endonuclease S subunit